MNQISVMSEAIRFNNLEKHFSVPGGTKLHALGPINLEIKRGTFVSLLGPSGCGKSTLLALAAGLDDVTSGSVIIDGIQLNRPNAAAGMMFQRDLLLEWRTAIENILLQFEMRGQSTEPHRQRARDLLQQVGIGQFADMLPKQMSGGMRQRVSICRALIHDPAILLMDEPFGALDAITREQMAIDLSRLTGESAKTVLFVTHSIEEAVFLADRVLVMSKRPGIIVADIEVPIRRPRVDWPRGESEFDPYVRAARTALEQSGAFKNVTPI